MASELSAIASTTWVMSSLRRFRGSGTGVGNTYASGVTDRWLGQLLGIDQQQGSEAEHPDCLLAVYPQNQALPPDPLAPFHHARSA